MYGQGFLLWDFFLPQVNFYEYKNVIIVQGLKYLCHRFCDIQNCCSLLTDSELFKLVVEFIRSGKPGPKDQLAYEDWMKS